MDDTISRQAAINALMNDIEPFVIVEPGTTCVIGAGIKDSDVIKMLEAMPSADVVKVVRCRDCKSFSHGYCKFHDAKFVREDGYCYWGERKDGEQNGSID